jgi:hypothetical protein
MGDGYFECIFSIVIGRHYGMRLIGIQLKSRRTFRVASSLLTSVSPDAWMGSYSVQCSELKDCIELFHAAGASIGRGGAGHRPQKWVSDLCTIMLLLSNPYSYLRLQMTFSPSKTMNSKLNQNRSVRARRLTAITVRLFECR